MYSVTLPRTAVVRQVKLVKHVHQFCRSPLFEPVVWNFKAQSTSSCIILVTTPQNNKELETVSNYFGWNTCSCCYGSNFHQTKVRERYRKYQIHGHQMCKFLSNAMQTIPPCSRRQVNRKCPKGPCGDRQMGAKHQQFTSHEAAATGDKWIVARG